MNQEDYDDVLVPKVTETFIRHPQVRCLYELGPEFSGFGAGAMWEDARIGISHLTGWERLAVVTDIEWIRLVMNAFHLIMPGELRLFRTTESIETRR